DGRRRHGDERAGQGVSVYGAPAGGHEHIKAITCRADEVIERREGRFKMKLPRRNFLQLAAGAAVLPALSRIAAHKPTRRKARSLAAKRVVDSLNVPGSIPVLPCIHKQHTASIAWMLQARPATTPAHA